MIFRILPRLFSADAMGLILVFAALQALTYGISSSLTNTDTRQPAYFFLVCLLGVLIAFGLHKRKISGLQASVGMTVLGVAGVWILGARLAAPLLDLGKAILSVLSQIAPALESKIPIDTTPIADAWLAMAEASNALSVRVQTWSLSFHQNVTVNDPLVRDMIWVLILWLLSAWMGWFAAGRNAVAALLPSILLLALITSYSELRIETLWLMVCLLLLLMGVWNYKNHTAQWERRSIDYSDSIRYDVTQAVVFLSLVIGTIALITPSISWREIREYLRQRGRNEIADSLGVQQQPVPARTISGPTPTLPREHLLSGGYAQSQDIVMTIRTGELPPVINPTFSPNAPRYYWRSTTYDTYEGAGWVTSSAPGQTYKANTPLIPGLLNGYRTLHLDVEMRQPEGELFWSGILFSTDVSIRADWRLRPQSNLFADQSTLLQADLFAVVSQARVYQAEAYVPLATVQGLRATSNHYPDYIRKRYLRLPESVPERVRRLADEITKGKTTAYDKAKAIEVYLRTYPYDLEVPAPPEEQDVADYFLFDLKKGYCDYYATAMVVLARASGLPARFVSGYASGSYDAVNAEYVVRELNAHSWAEVYFPEIGWIEFEPTAAQPEIAVPAFEGEITITPSEETPTRLLTRFRIEMLLYWFSPLVVVMLGLLLYLIWIERWIYTRLAPEIAIEKIYRRLYRLGRPLAGERTKAETAYEFMGKLSNTIDGIRQRSHFANYLSRAKDDVNYLTDIYQETLFAQRAVNKDDLRSMLRTWKYLRLRLILARLHLLVRRALTPTNQSPAFIQKLLSLQRTSR